MRLYIGKELKVIVAKMRNNTVPLPPKSVRYAKYLGCLRCFPASYYTPPATAFFEQLSIVVAQC
eukprot:2098989-Alexandrium_andersonii.AAC.2